MKIGEVENYYGGLHVEQKDGKYFWYIENYTIEDEFEIPKELYDALVKYETDRVK